MIIQGWNRGVTPRKLAREVGDALSYDFNLGCQPESKKVRVGA